MSEEETLIELLLKSFDVTAKAVHPRSVITKYVSAPPKGRLIVIGAGKASAAMAASFEAHYSGKIEGLVVTRYGHSVPTQYIEIIEAAHPVPDENCIVAVQCILQLVKNAGEDDLIVCLLSGGGSSLLSAPVDGVHLDDLQSLGKALLKSGAAIGEINCVRKHLNIALGGGIAKAAAGAKIITLAISDVVGDDPSIIASGCTVGDPSSLQDAKNILSRTDIVVPENIIDALDNPANETPFPDDPVFQENEYHLIATPMLGLKTAAEFWEKQGYSPYILGDHFEGDTNACALEHVKLAQSIARDKSNIKAPCVIISGGETTVKVTGSGDGGPNTQFVLKCAELLDGQEGIYVMACDTDGIDGSKDNAGAYATPRTLEKAKKNELDLRSYLAHNDSYHFFQALNQLVISGPTLTNVNDYRVLLIDEKE